MPNQFYVAPPNVSGGLEALMGGVKSMQLNSARQQAMQAMQSGDQRGALARLMSIGDTQGAQAIASFGNNERDFAFRQQQATQQQANSDRQYGLQRETANTAQIQTIENPDGTKTTVRIDRQGNATPVSVPGAQNTTPNNPFMTGGAMNEAQSKDGLYANRMLASERELRKVEGAGQSWGERVAGAVSDKIGYNIRGPEFQKFDQARRDFINATLRRESGAVISDAEFDNANKQYFPVPGDTQDVLKQKRANRRNAIEGIGAGAGKGYKPSLGFDQAGEIVERAPSGQPAQTAQPAQAPQQQASFKDGMTATGPGGKKIKFQGGQWVPVQ